MASKPLSISGMRAATAEEWDRVWQLCDYATYFHSRDWAEIWRNYSAGRLHPAPRLVTFSDGATALLPFSEERSLRGLIRKVISSPAGTYGGWISVDALCPQHLRLLSKLISEQCQNLTWRENPFGPRTTILSSGGFEDSTQLLDLTRVGDDATRLQSNGHRTAVPKAMRAGVTVCRARTRHDWDAYYAVYQASVRRWGINATNNYKSSLFQLLWNASTGATSADLWLAKQRGQVVAGAVCLPSKEIVVYWHGAALKSHFHARPVNLLLTRAIESYAKAGYRWFDFCPSGGHEGVAAFKRRFGTITVPTRVSTQTSRMLSCLLLARKTIKALGVEEQQRNR